MYILSEARFETCIQKSRFIACASPIEDMGAARTYILSLRREFHDATHVCSAYICGQTMHANDDGEPPQTAGRPILEQIQYAAIDKVCICVVRYFGGIQLGIGGLIRAYGNCAKNVLLRAKKARKITMRLYTVCYPYALSGAFAGWLRRHVVFLKETYGTEVSVLIAAEDPDIETQIMEQSKGRAVVTFIHEQTRLVPIEDPDPHLS